MRGHIGNPESRSPCGNWRGLGFGSMPRPIKHIARNNLNVPVQAWASLKQPPNCELRETERSSLQHGCVSFEVTPFQLGLKGDGFYKETTHAVTHTMIPHVLSGVWLLLPPHGRFLFFQDGSGLRCSEDCGPRPDGVDCEQFMWQLSSTDLYMSDSKCGLPQLAV